MSIIAVRGLALVFRDGRQVEDAATLASLVPFVDDEAEDLFSEFLVDGRETASLAGAIAPSGRMRFDHDGESTALRVSVEYVARRPLTGEELRALAAYTLGQWSDGIGEGGMALRSRAVDYLVQCITWGDGLPEEYPWVDLEDA